MLELLGWLILLVGVGVSIGLHEVGHLLPAKRFNVRVTQYMVGFGPTLWSAQRVETEYGIKAIPLGGYIRMIGMYPPAKDGAHGGHFSNLIADARAASQAEVKPGDDGRQFYQLSVPKRLVIMLGGPLMNLFLCAIFFTLALSVVGIPQLTEPPTVGNVSACLPTKDNLTGAANAARGCDSDPSPATAAGLQVGDVVRAVDGTPVITWTDLQTALKASGVGPVALRVERGGAELALTADLISVPRPVYESETSDTIIAFEDRPFLGMTPGSSIQPQPLSAVPQVMWQTTTRAVGAIISLPARLVDLVRVVTTEEKRDPNGIVGIVGVGRLTGEVVALDETPARAKAAQVLGILAGLNLFLFLFNLIPLLPLDGGHIAGALWESLRRWWARLRGRPDPGPVDVARALPIAYAVSIALIAMSVVVLYADLVKPITLQ